jgi:hypothetical protein
MSIYGLKYGGNIKYYLTGILMSLFFSVHAQETPLVVIGSQTGVPADISMNELKAVFHGERQRWSDGTKVVIAMIKSTSPLGNEISKKIYSMSGDEVRGFWARISFAGKFDPPNVFNTEAEVETFVSQNPGSIAILDKVNATPEVKTVLVGGKKTF